MAIYYPRVNTLFYSDLLFIVAYLPNFTANFIAHFYVTEKRRASDGHAAIIIYYYDVTQTRGIT